MKQPTNDLLFIVKQQELMNIFHKAFHYLDKGQHKRTNMETVCVLSLAFIFILFIPFVITLLATRTNTPAPRNAVPLAFVLSTLLILYSTWVARRIKLYKERDEHVQLRRSLFSLFLLGLAFLITQSIGWQEVLAGKEYRLTRIVMVIVAVHALHFLIALGLVLSLLIRTAPIKSAADSYIFFLNPNQNLFFKVSLLFWDYLGFLWVGLYLMILAKGT